MLRAGGIMIGDPQVPRPHPLSPVGVLESWTSMLLRGAQFGHWALAAWSLTAFLVVLGWRPAESERSSQRGHFGNVPTIAGISSNQSEIDALLARFRNASSIAIVGSSGNLRYRSYGADIDRHDVIIRVNGAVTKGYEHDAGFHHANSTHPTSVDRMPRLFDDGLTYYAFSNHTLRQLWSGGSKA